MKQLLRFFVPLLFIYPYHVSAQKADAILTSPFTVVCYNVENLFDTKHDSLKHDEEFLPEGIRHWTQARYRHKLKQVAQVIAATNPTQLPCLVGLCEVENDSVLTALTRYSPLRNANYRYLMTHSADVRGIDVALLYQPSHFKPLAAESIQIPLPPESFRPTRDILHVIGLLPSADTLDVFVIHFPSRIGGSKLSEPSRSIAARTLRQATDSLFALRSNPYILIMGDFNDVLNSSTLRKELDAAGIPAHPESKKLYQLLPSPPPHTGSYKYRRHWQLIDHLIISGSMLQPDAAIQAHPKKAGILNAPFLLTEDNRYGGLKPLRTYHGMKYQGGYSDHLPVWGELWLQY